MKPDHPLIVKQFTRGQFHYIAVIDPVTNKVCIYVVIQSETILKMLTFKD